MVEGIAIPETWDDIERTVKVTKAKKDLENIVVELHRSFFFFFGKRVKSVMTPGQGMWAKLLVGQRRDWAED
jgi:hypothetical protein